MGDDLGFSKVKRERQLAQASKGQLREMATELRNMRVVDVSGGAHIQILGFSGSVQGCLHDLGFSGTNSYFQARCLVLHQQCK